MHFGHEFSFTFDDTSDIWTCTAKLIHNRYYLVGTDEISLSMSHLWSVGVTNVVAIKLNLNAERL